MRVLQSRTFLRLSGTETMQQQHTFPRLVRSDANRYNWKQDPSVHPKSAHQICTSLFWWLVFQSTYTSGAAAYPNTLRRSTIQRRTDLWNGGTLSHYSNSALKRFLWLLSLFEKMFYFAHIPWNTLTYYSWASDLNWSGTCPLIPPLSSPPFQLIFFSQTDVAYACNIKNYFSSTLLDHKSTQYSCLFAQLIQQKRRSRLTWAPFSSRLNTKEWENHLQSLFKNSLALLEIKVIFLRDVSTLVYITMRSGLKRKPSHLRTFGVLMNVICIYQ